MGVLAASSGGVAALRKEAETETSMDLLSTRASCNSSSISLVRSWPPSRSSFALSRLMAPVSVLGLQA